MVGRSCPTIDRVARQDSAVRVLEDDDRGSDDLEVHRHFRESMLVISTAAREDEEAIMLYFGDPIHRRVHIVVQREDAHLNILQVHATVEHVTIAIRHQTIGRQFRCEGQVLTTVEHSAVATFSQLGSRQSRSLREIRTMLEHALIAIRCQVGDRQDGAFHQTSATEHARIAMVRQYRGRQFRDMGYPRTTTEHIVIAIGFHDGSLQCRHFHNFMAATEHIRITIILQFRGGQFRRDTHIGH